MAFQGTAFQPTAFQSGGNVPDPALQNLKFTNGQTEEQVKGLIGFAGSALLWASLAALTAVPQPTLQAAEMTFGQHEAFVVQANQSAQYFNSCVIPGNILQAPARRPIFSARPQDDPTVIQPVTFLPMMLVAHDRGTFGSVYPDQELLEWNPSFFNRRLQSAPVAGTVVPPKVQADVGPQESLEQPQPLWKGQVPRQSPAFKQWTIPPQENQEQTQPVLFGQQPLPAPALGPIRYTSSEADLSNRSIFWGGTATLPIAATQTILPALKPIIVGAQETEPVQPVFLGQQPLPAPAFKPWTAAPQEGEKDSAAVWNGSQTLLLGVVASPTFRQISVVGQESTEQTQPTYWGGRATLNLAAIQFYLPPGHEFVAVPQESGEQFQPVFVGQQPLPSPALGSGRFAWPIDTEQTAVQYGEFWVGDATLYIAVTQDVPPKPKLIIGGQESGEQPQPQTWGHNEDVFLAAFSVPLRNAVVVPQQESGEQTQPIFAGQQPLPSPALGPIRTAGPIDTEQTAVQYGTVWVGDASLYVAVTQDVPPKPKLIIGAQESGEQQQPVFIGQQPLPSPAVGLSKVAAPSDVEAVARASEFAAFWDGKATLQIAAVQFDLPPSRRVNAVPPESGEQFQPVIFGQQPLPSPALGPIKLAGPIDTEQTAVQYGEVWVGDASLYVAVTQDVPRKPALLVSGQESTDQIQPQVWGRNEDAFLAASTVPQRPALIVGGQESGEQPQPIFSGQQPLPAPASAPIKVAAPSDPEAIARASESAAFWDGKASLHIAAVQYDLPPSRRVSASPQESGEQAQPVVVGQQPLPSPQLGSTRLAAPIDAEQTAIQYGEFWVGDATLYVAVTQDVPAKHALIVGEQESTEQIQPQFAHPRITADSIASRFIWQSGDAEGSQGARFWHGQFIADLVPGEVQIRRTLVVPEQAYQFQPQPQFNLYYFLDSLVVPPVVETGGGGDRGVNLFREEKPKPQKVKPANFTVRFEQHHQTFVAQFEAASELRIRWVAEPVLGEFQTELEASSEFRFRSTQKSGFALAFDVHGTQQKQVPVKAIHQPMRVGVEFVAPDSELHIRFEVEE